MDLDSFEFPRISEGNVKQVDHNEASNSVKTIQSALYSEGETEGEKDWRDGAGCVYGSCVIRSLAGLVHGLILSGSFEIGYVAFNQDDKMEKVAVEQARWLTNFMVSA